MNISGRKITINQDHIGKKSRELLRKIDSDGSGSISIKELVALKTEHEEEQQQSRRLKKLIVALLVFLIILLLSTFSSSYTAIELSKEVRTQPNGVMVVSSGNIAQTSEALTTIKLFHAPVLEMKQLRTIKDIKYSLPEQVVDGTTVKGKVEVSELVVSVSKMFKTIPELSNKTVPAVTIVTASGVKLLVDIFKAALVVNGKAYPLCGALTCSSFRFDNAGLTSEELNARVIHYVGAGHARKLEEDSDCEDIEEADTDGDTTTCQPDSDAPELDTDSYLWVMHSNSISVTYEGEMEDSEDCKNIAFDYYGSPHNLHDHTLKLTWVIAADATSEKNVLKFLDRDPTGEEDIDDAGTLDITTFIDYLGGDVPRPHVIMGYHMTGVTTSTVTPPTAPYNEHEEYRNFAHLLMDSMAYQENEDGSTTIEIYARQFSEEHMTGQDLEDAVLEGVSFYFQVPGNHNLEDDADIEAKIYDPIVFAGQTPNLVVTQDPSDDMKFILEYHADEINDLQIVQFGKSRPFTNSIGADSFVTMWDTDPENTFYVSNPNAILGVQKESGTRDFYWMRITLASFDWEFHKVTFHVTQRRKNVDDVNLKSLEEGSYIQGAIFIDSFLSTIGHGITTGVRAVGHGVKWAGAGIVHLMTGSGSSTGCMKPASAGCRMVRANRNALCSPKCGGLGSDGMGLNWCCWCCYHGCAMNSVTAKMRLAGKCNCCRCWYPCAHHQCCAGLYQHLGKSLEQCGAGHCFSR
eukprot:gnl/MRDRNA2_/MRDRNA2_133600_c0_seq1.p1 gnl/MRDRNA2_/MRDRNA2_133600_c0~~gnl/MRDRNA2_/MRDRNA2_133600_c0_seq1.p1  ORF type:complete len:746 (+),score=109.73 gnl/MRDRNA2_/MRDRNA2_133600_c0_seq1:3-2240(+)